MQFCILKNKIYNDHNFFQHYGPIRIYRRALEELGSEKLADEFMLSSYGGFSPSELERLKYQMNYKKNRKA